MSEVGLGVTGTAGVVRGVGAVDTTEVATYEGTTAPPAT
jgi:hypothetical protein